MTVGEKMVKILSKSEKTMQTLVSIENMIQNDSCGCGIESMDGLNKIIVLTREHGSIKNAMIVDIIRARNICFYFFLSLRIRDSKKRSIVR